MSLEVRHFPEHLEVNPERVLELEDGVYMGKDGYYAINETVSYKACVKVEMPFTAVKPTILWKQDKIPALVFAKIISYFWEVFDIQRTEAICHLYVATHPRAPLDKKFKIIVQTEAGVSSGTVRGNPNARIPGYVFLGSVHSHGNMSAFHSAQDQESERQINGLHIVVGNLNSYSEITISSIVSVNGERFPISPEQVIEGIYRANSPLPPNSIPLMRVLTSRGKALSATWLKAKADVSELVSVSNRADNVLVGPNLELISTSEQKVGEPIRSTGEVKQAPQTQILPPTPPIPRQSNLKRFKNFLTKLLVGIGWSDNRSATKRSLSVPAEEGAKVREHDSSPTSITKHSIPEVQKTGGVVVISDRQRRLENRPWPWSRYDSESGRSFLVPFSLDGTYESILPEAAWIESAKQSYRALRTFGESRFYGDNGGRNEREFTTLNLDGSSLGREEKVSSESTKLPDDNQFAKKEVE